MINMLKTLVLCFYLLFVSYEGALASPSHAECSTALYKGLLQTFGILQGQVTRLMKEGRLDRSVKPTCEFLSIVKDATLGRFYDSNCTWGSDTFEKRFFSLIGELLEEDCKAFSSDIRDEKAICTPREELFAALNKTYTCMVEVVRDVYQANGITAYGRVQDLCQDLENFGPCFEGVVDNCHDDGGETSKSVLDALAAIVTFAAKAVFPSDMFIDQLATCAEDTKNQNWLTSRVAGIPLDWTPPSVNWIPDIILVNVLSGGTEVNFDSKVLNEFIKDLHEMTKAINEKVGV